MYPGWPVPGSLEEALRLIRLKARHNFWFWMTRSCPGVEQHHAQWPARSRLHGVRMTQRNQEGKILNWHKDDDLWQKILSA